jgi:hypothetical protein
MSLADLLSGRPRVADRLPEELAELRGPESGVIVLPRHLSWPGLRECDLADDAVRRSVYGIVLAQGQRNDVARFLNARLLLRDWPMIRELLHPRLRRRCEQRLALPDQDDARSARR